MKKALEFFYKGPGLIIIIVAAIIGGGLWMRQKQDAKTKAIEEKGPKHELGKLNPQTPVDTTKVQQEVDLDKRQIAPAYRSVPEEGRQMPEPTPLPIAHPKLDFVLCSGDGIPNAYANAGAYAAAGGRSLVPAFSVHPLRAHQHGELQPDGYTSCRQGRARHHLLEHRQRRQRPSNHHDSGWHGRFLLRERRRYTRSHPGCRNLALCFP